MKALYFLAILSFLYLSSCEETTSSDRSSTRVIIVGAGPSGIAAASKLFENGFENVKILEGENRIGGRVYTTTIGDYNVDIGGQWVHGEKNNTSYELAWPLGLLEHLNDSDIAPLSMKLFGSSGDGLSKDVMHGIIDYLFSFADHIPDDLSTFKTGSYGEFVESKLMEYLQAHPEIPEKLHMPIIKFIELFRLALDASETWHDLSAKMLKVSPDCEGDQMLNWKERGYGTILDILMKKYPNPEEELPVMKNTIINDKVTKINYGGSDGVIKVTTKGGTEHLADHLIWTGSLGVLKADHENIFNPSLPEKKINAIKNLGMGHVAKIFMYYDNPWWIDDVYMKGIFWTEDDRKEMAMNPDKKWMLSAYGIIPVEHKPKLLCLWMTGPHVTDMERVPEDVFHNQVVELLQRIYGHAYNVTEPKMIVRSMWNTNENFRGTYSYPHINAEKSNASRDDLAEPIMKDDKPIVQFAGEATAYYYATVNGAIDSGRREAERLMKIYPSKN